MKYIIPILLALSLASCGSSDSEKELESIEITSSATELALGDSASLKVTAQYTGDLTENLSASEVSLTLSAEDVISLNAYSVTTLQEGVVTVTASYEGFEDTIELTVAPAELRQLVVSDTDISLPLGTSYQFEVEAIYSDDSTVAVTPLFTDFDTNFVDVSPEGLLTTVAPGISGLAIIYEGLEESAVITVTEAEPTSLALSLSPAQVAAGETSTALVSVTYTDGTILDKTSEAAIQSESSLVTIDGSTIETSASGEAVISASVFDLSDSATLTISEAVPTSITLSADSTNVPVGLTLQVSAEAYYTDGSVRDVTTEANWTVSNETVATVSTLGVVAGLVEGSTEVSAQFSGYTQSLAVNVTEAVVTQVHVSPATEFSTYEGANFYATASGVYSDGTTRDITAEVTWASDNTTVATVSNHSESAGQVTAVAPGDAIISASTNGLSDSFALTVEELVITSIEVTTAPLSTGANSKVPFAKLTNPSELIATNNAVSANLTDGRTLQLYAIGTFQNGDVADITADVSWAISNTSVAQFETPAENPGLVTARSTGTAEITASIGAIEGSYSLTVIDAVLESLSFTHSWTRVFTGDSENALVAGTFSNGDERDVTADASWQTSDASVFQASNQVGAQGVITGVSAGEATLTASLDGISVTQAVSVVDNVIESVAITAISDFVYVARELRLSAFATMTSGDEVDVTSTGTWSVDNTSLATIATSGVLNALSDGNVVVTYTSSNGVSNTFNVRIKPISEMANDFSKSLSASVSMINGIVQQGSQFYFQITNNIGQNFDLIEYKATDSQGIIAQTTDPNLLNGGTIGWTESYGLNLTVGAGGATVPLTFTFVVRDPVSGESFNVSTVYQ